MIYIIKRNAVIDFDQLGIRVIISAPHALIQRLLNTYYTIDYQRFYAYPMYIQDGKLLYLFSFSQPAHIVGDVVYKDDISIYIEYNYLCPLNMREIVRDVEVMTWMIK